MKFLTLMGILFMQLGHSATLKVLHYNIQELDTTKIQNNDPQLNYVKKVIAKYKYDLLSLNEIQFDSKNVPTAEFQTTGLNIERFLKAIKSPLKNYSFHQANTGNNARPKADGTYYILPNDPAAREYADQINFGTMPGQYSTALASKFPILGEKIITDLKWKDFNPKADFSKFLTADGKKFPDDIPLFDKNFSDIIVPINKKEVHIILLHTVPSYHFGNKHSINMYRNAEQLRFLEWYLTGKTDYPINIKGLTPLISGSRFIAMGDFNISFKRADSEGANVLKRLFKKTQPWIDPEKLSFTNESSHFGPKPSRLLLDYILVSKNIKVKKGEILHPDFTRIEAGCKGASELKGKKLINPKSFIKVDYTDANKTCYAYIKKEQYYFKKASDHFPLYGEFIIE